MKNNADRHKAAAGTGMTRRKFLVRTAVAFSTVGSWKTSRSASAAAMRV